MTMHTSCTHLASGLIYDLESYVFVPAGDGEGGGWRWGCGGVGKGRCVYASLTLSKLLYSACLEP